MGNNPIWNQTEKKWELEGCSTRYLLSLMKKGYPCSASSRSWALRNGRMEEYEKSYGYDPCDTGGAHTITFAEIKAVLATRPHIPGKLEAKAQRQLKAKQRKDRSRRRLRK